MTDIATLESTYFVQASDAHPPTEPIPRQFQDCRITPLIDCAAYCAELDAALATVGTGPDAASNPGHFVLIANWWLGLSGGTYVPSSKEPSGFGPGVVNMETFRLDGPGGSKVLIDILKDKARRGVDVRVLGWVSVAVMDSVIAQKSGAESIARVNSLTMQSIKDLRAEPTIGAKAMLNVIAHAAGAVHSKLVIIGTNTQAMGFTGGIDLEMGRWAHPDHPNKERWHDVVAKVEGPAVQALYDWYQQMWHENVSREAKRFRFAGEDMLSYLPGAPDLPTTTLPVPAMPVGKHHIQSLRTVPAANYAWDNCLPSNPPLSFASQGLFEFRAAMAKALPNAQTYIYMEDQSFWAQETLSWINTAIKARPGLRVILMIEGAADPNDPAFSDAPLCNAINHGLLQNLTAAQQAQVRMYRRTGIIVHAKTTLIDDEFAVIGSANCMRRSLYTDMEHSVSVIDPDELLVKKYRKDLWAGHFKHPNPDDFDGIQAALHAFESSWGTAGSAPARPAWIEPIMLPITPDVPLDGSAKTRYDSYLDADSRQDWGGLCP